MGIVLLTSKQVAERLGMSTQALRMAGYRGYLPFKPLTSDITGRRSLLYVAAEVEAHLQSLVSQRDVRQSKNVLSYQLGSVPLAFRN